MIKLAGYQLINQATQQIRFEAMYVKYYFETPYCAIFEEYPAASTRILICRRLPDGEQNYRVTRCSLISRTLSGERKDIGTYVIEKEVRTEKDATAAVEASLRGTVALQRALGGISNDS